MECPHGPPFCDTQAFYLGALHIWGLKPAPCLHLEVSQFTQPILYYRQTIKNISLCTLGWGRCNDYFGILPYMTRVPPPPQACLETLLYSFSVLGREGQSQEHQLKETLV